MFEELVSMRDGVKLHTRIWTPPGSGPFSVVLERGYWPGREKHATLFPQAGYTYVGQKARGNLDGGMFFPDAQDGYDCIEWIARQPWCDGNVLMYGRSFMGATQWLAATEHPPHLRGIVPQNINGDPWQRQYRDHGALQLAHTARRIYLNESGDATRIVDELGRDRFYRHLPLITLDEATVGRRNRLWREYVSHATYDDYWQAISIRDKYDRIKVPVYIMGGWYDNYPGAAFDSYLALQARGAVQDVRIVIGPCDHLNNSACT
jgi:putative CocE/NonD family hydrolase